MRRVPGPSGVGLHGVVGFVGAAGLVAAAGSGENGNRVGLAGVFRLCGPGGTYTGIGVGMVGGTNFGIAILHSGFGWWVGIAVSGRRVESVRGGSYLRRSWISEVCPQRAPDFGDSVVTPGAKRRPVSAVAEDHV